MKFSNRLQWNCPAGSRPRRNLRSAFRVLQCLGPAPPRAAGARFAPRPREPDGEVVSAATKNEIGCVVVVDKVGKPRGLITERDVVRRVSALDLLPSKVQAGKSMTKPPATIESSANVTDAAKKMREMKIRRLVVVQGNKLTGIITSRENLRRQSGHHIGRSEILVDLPDIAGARDDRADVGILQHPGERQLCKCAT